MFLKVWRMLVQECLNLVRSDPISPGKQMPLITQNILPYSLE